MRMRCYLWPCNLPNDLFCKCGAGLTLSHLFNCNRFISYRSTLHDAVRDQIHAMCNSYHIESFVEPLLRSLDINESVRDSEYGKRRADVVVPSFDDVMNVVDVVTVDYPPLMTPNCTKKSSSQKNSNSKNDQRAVKNTKLSKNVPRCSSCHKVGHKKNSKKCENYQNSSISYSVTAAAAELNNLEFNLPPKDECTAEDNDAVMLDIPLEASQIDNCAICNEKAERYILKNNLYVCHVFTPKKQPKNKTVRKLLLRGRYGSGKNALFSSDLAPVTDETVNQLVDLHPAEFLNLDKPSASQFWKQNPLSEKEVETAIFRLPSGKAPGPSGITFDMLKSVCRQNSFIIKDLCSFFQDVLTMKIVPPKELSASRLVALTKPNGKVRPIAIGEAIYRLMSSVIFNRVSTKAKEYFSPFQYGIKTIDGASVAALTSDLFFNCHENSCIFNLDFKNAFNSVKRDSIWKEIKSNFPELETFFYRFYGNSSDLIFNSFNLDSLSGVKQGDPLGPFFFCLAIHPILKKIKRRKF
ncbi:hypothetical protein P9112_008510 [Eukaryota sp. TZLM1-RC]